MRLPNVGSENVAPPGPSDGNDGFAMTARSERALYVTAAVAS
jgi:hypothetical protein